MSELQDKLKALKPTKEFFIGIDSDGCAFDTLEIKHKECFCPNFIEHYRCQAFSKYTREAWEFVNLYSKTRGCNRWLAVQRVIRLLGERPEVLARGAKFPMAPAIDVFVKAYTTYSNETLAEYIEKADDEMKPLLQAALEWSLAVNKTIARMVHDVPPFPGVRESLQKAAARADMIVVSQTPTEALEREWKEHDIARFVHAIAGQEFGKKGEHLALAAGGKFPAGKILMIGDAPGDYKAARENSALFCPINPGDEEASWKRFLDEGLDRFFDGAFAGEYQKTLLAEFEACLPENPPWA